MDEFGRLPTDVIGLIKEFYQLPLLDIIEEKDEEIEDKIILKIVMNNITYNVNLLPPLQYEPGFYIPNYPLGIYKYVINEFYQFIQQLRFRTPCKCKVGQISEFIYDGNIKIIFYGNDIVLNGNCLDIFIDAMQKYYEILNKYPKWSSYLDTDINMDDVPDNAWD